MTKLERILTATFVVLALAGGLLAGTEVAGATSLCNEYTSHSGNVPGSYDYAIFIETQNLSNRPDINFNSGEIEVPSGGLFYNPDRFDGAPYFYNNSTWDKVLKCNRPDETTTTTTIATTTTTVADTTTTTVADTTTTTQEETTSTTKPEEETTTTTIQQETSTTPPSTTTTTVVLSTTTTGESSTTTTSTLPSTSTTPPLVTTTTVITTPSSTLPFTGMESDDWFLAGMMAFGIGGLVLLWARQLRKDDDASVSS